MVRCSWYLVSFEIREMRPFSLFPPWLKLEKTAYISKNNVARTFSRARKALRKQPRLARNAATTQHIFFENGIS